jgi:hypothetical protein
MSFKLAAAIGVAALAAVTAATKADAADPWVDRPITLPRLVFAGDVGLGLGHIHAGNRDFFGPGLNLEGAIGVTDRVELGLRTGIRLNDDAKVTQADNFGRTFFLDTWGVNADSVANPEFHVRWAAVQGRVVELALDGRVYVPIEQGSDIGLMFGVPLAFHIGNSVRIDTGAYMPIVFHRHSFFVFSIPGYFWFQVSDRLWLGPVAEMRFINPDVGASHNDLLLGFALGYQVANAVDLKTWMLFPAINQDQGGQYFGVGFGVQLRIE